MPLWVAGFLLFKNWGLGYSARFRRIRLEGFWFELDGFSMLRGVTRTTEAVYLGFQLGGSFCKCLS